MSGSIQIVVGGQFGSEAKGHVAAILIEGAQLEIKDSGIVAVRVGGPNAGHTVIDDTGRRWPLRTIPVAAPISGCDLVLAAGCEIEYSVLEDEVLSLEAAGYTVGERLYIDQAATELTGYHHEIENAGRMTERLGSTGKGVGAARAERLMRRAPIVADNDDFRNLGIICDTTTLLRERLRSDHQIVIEGTQGYGLGLHAGFYPFCTSGDCRSIDFLQQTGLPPQRVSTWVVYRTMPIRVAGNSGPMWNEVSWADLAKTSGGYIQPEQTTVTKKTRRIGLWDAELANSAWQANGGGDNDHAVLTFVDYLDPKLAGCTSWQELVASNAWRVIEGMQDDVGAEFDLFTTSPTTHIWRP